MEGTRHPPETWLSCLALAGCGEGADGGPGSDGEVTTLAMRVFRVIPAAQDRPFAISGAAGHADPDLWLIDVRGLSPGPPQRLNSELAEPSPQIAFSLHTPAGP